jgi:hypothetical protein
MPTSSKPPGYLQFSIGRILWTMFVCCLLAAAVRALDWPTEVQIPLLTLLLLYGAYAIVRLPSVVGDLRGRSAKWSKIEEQRAELQRFADQRLKEPRVNDLRTAGEHPRTAGTNTSSAQLTDMRSADGPSQQVS